MHFHSGFLQNAADAAPLETCVHWCGLLLSLSKQNEKKDERFLYWAVLFLYPADQTGLVG